MKVKKENDKEVKFWFLYYVLVASILVVCGVFTGIFINLLLGLIIFIVVSQYIIMAEIQRIKLEIRDMQYLDLK